MLRSSQFLVLIPTHVWFQIKSTTRPTASDLNSTHFRQRISVHVHFFTERTGERCLNGRTSPQKVLWFTSTSTSHDKGGPEWRSRKSKSSRSWIPRIRYAFSFVLSYIKCNVAVAAYAQYKQRRVPVAQFIGDDCFEYVDMATVHVGRNNQRSNEYRWLMHVVSSICHEHELRVYIQREVNINLHRADPL
jgi:hypothetical protein